VCSLSAVLLYCRGLGAFAYAASLALSHYTSAELTMCDVHVIVQVPWTVLWRAKAGT
jgi:hypothetical protein